MTNHDKALIIQQKLISLSSEILALRETQEYDSPSYQELQDSGDAVDEAVKFISCAVSAGVRS